jgi:heme/copper-type cytochrome/quinol oxidase subunit 2
MTALPQLAGHPAQDALNAAGIQAAHVENLWWLMFWICALAFAATMIALAWALLRARRADARGVGRDSGAVYGRGKHEVSGGNSGVTVIESV